MSLMLRCGKCGDAKRFQIDVTVQYSTANVCRYFIADSQFLLLSPVALWCLDFM